MLFPDQSAERAPAGNLATGWLKLIAVFFMFIDHSGKMLFANMQEMRMLGRIAFPIYVWCMIVGLHYTRSVPKYLLRVLAVGILSQPLYMWGLNHTWNQPNIFLTLALGLCALWGIREKRYGSEIWAPAAAILLANVLRAVYGWKGIMLFILLYAVRDSRSGIAAVTVAWFLFWGTYYKLFDTILGIRIPYDQMTQAVKLVVQPFLHLETMALLSLPFLLIRFRKDIRLPKWVSYGLYPAHLLLLIALEKIVGV